MLRVVARIGGRQAQANAVAETFGEPQDDPARLMLHDRPRAGVDRKRAAAVVEQGVVAGRVRFGGKDDGLRRLTGREDRHVAIGVDPKRGSARPRRRLFHRIDEDDARTACGPDVGEVRADPRSAAGRVCGEVQR